MRRNGMTLPSVVRIFFAIAIPDAIKHDLSLFMDDLKKRVKSNAIRWIRPENLHITLQFLAKVESADLGGMVKNVRERLQQVTQPPVLHFDQLCLFPHPYRPRVIVLNVTPQEPLAKLASLIGEGIKLSGYETEDRIFRAHLTLGRIKIMQSINPTTLLQNAVVTIKKFEVNEVVLFRSEPQTEGSSYSILEHIKIVTKVNHEA
jgi:2'-5' RNA ligase